MIPCRYQILRFAMAAAMGLALAACEVQVLDADQFAAPDIDAAPGDDAAGDVSEDVSPVDTTGNPCPAGCDDQNPCTEDSCTGPGQCAHAPLSGGQCADDSACTVGDTCLDGACKPGKLKECPSTDACLVAKCDPTQNGACKLSEADDGSPCNDQSACSESDKCKGGACKGTPVLCKDDNPCTIDECDAKKGCAFVKADGKVCDDDNPCTLGDVCADGACKEGKAKECISPDPCYSSKCSLATGGCKLTEIAEGETCNDGNKCTEKDICKGGNCKGAVIACDDTNPCTTDSCDGKTGCATAAAAGPCDDQNPCTAKDNCAGGSCAGTPSDVSATCDDGNPCTADGCDPKAGCTHTAAAGACSDGNPCTAGDACAQGKCAAGANTCSCQVDADCAKEEDGDLCNGTLFCDKSEASPKCKVLPQSVVVCDTKADSACSGAKCDSKSGKCAPVAAADGKACDADGSVCTQFDACAAGKCKAGATLPCDDKNPCTTDICGSASGCVYGANASACDADGDACTTGDKCQDKVCLAGAKVVCDDNEACTVDSCDAKTGKCVYAGASLEGQACNADNSACTDGDKCTAGKCTAGALKNCNDNNACTTDNCDAKAGCGSVPSTVPCDDGNGCTSGDQCAQGKCSGSAINVAVLCDDKNGCTTDSCEPAKGCVHTNHTAPCEDGNVCTTGDACAGGKCVGGASQCSCQSDAECPDDNNLCNGTAFCDKAAPPFTCKTKPGTTVTCSAANDTTCAINTCDSKTGKCAMQPTNNSKSCDDGSACTTGETCATGACKPTGTVTCNDDQVCTTDACDPKAGCTYTANTAACTDNNACTTGDTCKSGACFAGSQVVCDDKNPCTTDLCDKATGCKTSANTIPCNDGNACTANEYCSAGKCGGGNAVVCNDNNPCTTDACDPSKGCTTAALPDGSACTDNNPCTAGDGCKAGACQTTGPTVCDDKNSCTSDSCDASKGGCQQAPKPGTACDDGDKCTGSSAAPDACSAQGQCTPGAKVACNDGNLCTVDSCAPGTGCTFANNTLGCDDGQPCTLQDKCTAGKCAGTPGAPDLDGDGFKSAACTGGNDCNDNDKAINPGVKEDCATAADDNCANGTNEQDAQNCSAFALDEDGDGFGQQSASGSWISQCWCVAKAGSTYTASTAKKPDCNDGDKNVNPGATEDCQTQGDDDCDGSLNNLGAKNCQKFYEDTDSDGYYGAGASSMCMCFEMAPYLAQKGGDCDDKSNAISPGVEEDCTTPQDDNCNGSGNDQDAKNCKPWYLDADQDGFYASAGSGAQSQCWCAPSGKFSANSAFGGDCDDQSWAVAPNKAEICDGIDQNCNKISDEGCDDDDDGFCDAKMRMTATALCQASAKPGGYGAADLGRVLILAGAAANSSVPGSVRSIVNSFYVFEGVDIRYATAGIALPTVSDLRRYDVIVLLNDGTAPYDNPTELGDRLIEFVNGGGGLLMYGVYPKAGYQPAGALAAAGLPFDGAGNVGVASWTVASGAGVGPSGSALCQDGNSAADNLIKGGDSLGSFASVSGITLAKDWTHQIAVGSNTPMVATRNFGTGRVVALNALASSTHPLFTQIVRTAARWLAKGWGSDCDDVSKYTFPGGQYDLSCDGMDQDCSGFDNCSTQCSDVESVDAAIGWTVVATSTGPDDGVPATVNGTTLSASTPWKTTFWADAGFASVKSQGMCYGQPDDPAPSTAAPVYPDSGSQWQVARKTFTTNTGFSRIEFRYRYQPDIYESGDQHDLFAVRLDNSANKLLTLAPNAAKPTGGWHTVAYTVSAGAGSHTIYLFFKTGDTLYNNGPGVSFDDVRVCNQ